MKSALARYFVSRSRPVKITIVLAVDLMAAMACGWLVLCLAAESLLLPSQSNVLVLAVFAVFQTTALWASSAYRTVSRFMGLSSISRSVQFLIGSAFLQVLLLSLWRPTQIPLSFAVEAPALFLSAFLATRFLAAQFLGLAELKGSHHANSASTAIIYGAGEAGRELAMGLNHSSNFKVIGFVDEDRNLEGAVIQGLPVHAPSSLPGVIASRQISHVLLAMPSVTRARRAEIVDSLADLGVKVMTLPSLSDLAHGHVSVRDLRNIDIEDLLGRETAKPNEILLNKDTRGKVVLVTGAGGSIGSEICRQIMQRNPAKLVLLDVSEPALYLIDTELKETYPDAEVVAVLCSVQDQSQLNRMMDLHRPDTVYHAAAYKHVPLVESNECAGVLNNVLGTWNCAQAAIAAGVGKFTLISTDKAVRPTNVMGATKRVSELILQALAKQTNETQFSMVRFGNVLGSSGSVVPRFRQQIEDGGPITLTHKEITRYFMTIPEATELVLQAGAMGGSGEVFVLDMGEPVKILDLAYRMVALSGLKVRDEARPDGDIEIEVTGLRPGEKLYEELLIGNNPLSTSHPGIFMAREDFLQLDELKGKLLQLITAALANDVRAVRAILQELVNGYNFDGEVLKR